MTDHLPAVDLDDAYASFDEVWSPRVAARVNDYDVKIAKGAGDFPAHVHADTDEFFLVLEGELTLTMPDQTVVLAAGQLFTVPAGTRHQPSATPGTRLMFIEPRGVMNTGDDDGSFLASEHSQDSFSDRTGTTGHSL